MLHGKIASFWRYYMHKSTIINALNSIRHPESSFTKKLYNGYILGYKEPSQSFTVSMPVDGKYVCVIRFSGIKKTITVRGHGITDPGMYRLWNLLLGLRGLEQIKNNYWSDGKPFTGSRVFKLDYNPLPVQLRQAKPFRMISKPKKPAAPQP